jgi:hypothetical protein
MESDPYSEIIQDLQKIFPGIIQSPQTAKIIKSVGNGYQVGKEVNLKDLVPYRMDFYFYLN